MLGGTHAQYITTFDGQKWKGKKPFSNSFNAKIKPRKGTYCILGDGIYFINSHRQVCKIDTESFAVQLVDDSAEVGEIDEF